jgi:hypothetical protein
MLDVEHVRLFVDESIRLRCSWEKIKLQGGEPTLHPEIETILELLGKYRSFQMKAVKESNLDIPTCAYTLFTNGTHGDVLNSFPKWFNVINSNMKKTKLWKIFQSVNVAPIDLEEYRNQDGSIFDMGCHRVTTCGPGMGTNGLYYPCMVAYHVDRVFKLNTGIVSLEEYLNMPDDELRKRVLRKCCAYCGFFKYPRDITAKQQISPSWQKAFEEFRDEPDEPLML